MSQLFYVMTMPGLETLAFSEVRAVITDAELVRFAGGIALFHTEGQASDLLDLRTVEDVFLCLEHIKGMGHGPDALRVLHSATVHADIPAAIRIWQSTHHGAMPRTWRVVGQMTGSYVFRRIDAIQTLESALQRTMPRRMQQVEDDADLEVWVWLGPSAVFIGMRLSDATMRHRIYKREHLPASLRPTVAAAMSLLSRPTEQDIVLDPMCGAGTILIERGLMAPLAKALGGDIREEAVTIARRNAHAAEIEVNWRVWDAQALPLEDASVTRIISNLPFGKQIGTHEANVKLYRNCVREFERVLTRDGVLVTLTSEDRLWDALLREHGWRVVKKIVFVVLGQPASIFVAERA